MGPGERVFDFIGGVVEDLGTVAAAHRSVAHGDRGQNIDRNIGKSDRRIDIAAHSGGINLVVSREDLRAQAEIVDERWGNCAHIIHNDILQRILALKVRRKHISAVALDHLSVHLGVTAHDVIGLSRLPVDFEIALGVMRVAACEIVQCRYLVLEGRKCNESLGYWIDRGYRNLVVRNDLACAIGRAGGRHIELTAADASARAVEASTC